MTNEYQIYLLEEMKTNEVVTENADGSYTIFINDRLCEEKRRLALEHALRHIEGNDFEKADVQIIEQNAHCST